MLSVNRYRIRHRAAAGERRARLLERLLAKPGRLAGREPGDPRAGQRRGFDRGDAAGAAHAARVRAAGDDGAADGRHHRVLRAGAEDLRAVHAEPVALGSAYIYRVLLWITLPGAAGHQQRRPRLPAPVRRAPPDARRPCPQHRRAAHGRRRGEPADPGAPPADAAVDPRPRARHRERHHDPAPGDRRRSTSPRDWEDLLDRLRQTPHTRLPVYDGELDNLIGVLHMKRAAQELARGTLTRERLIEIAAAREALLRARGHHAHAAAGAVPAQPPPAGLRRRRVRRHRRAGHARGPAGGDRRRVHHRPGDAAHKDVHRKRAAPGSSTASADDPRAQSLARLATADRRSEDAERPAAREARDDTRAGHGAAHRRLRIRGAADRRQRHPHGARAPAPRGTRGGPDYCSASRSASASLRDRAQHAGLRAGARRIRRGRITVV